MIVKIKISSEKIYNFLNKYQRWILTGLFLVLLFINVFVYYQYVYLTMAKEPAPRIKKVNIDEENLKKILNNLDVREQALLRTKTTNYIDPFK